MGSPRTRTLARGNFRRKASPWTWEEVLRNLTDAVLLVGGDGIVLSCNPAAEDLLDLPQAHICGRPLREVLSSTPKVVRLVERSLGSGQSQTDARASLARRGGEIPVRVAVSPLLDEKDRVDGVALVLHDLRYERTLEEGNRRNEHLEKLATVVAGLAHELRNPLGGIRGAAQLLERLVLPSVPEARRYTDLIARETNRLSELVDELLTFGTLAPPRDGAVNIHRVLREVLELVSPARERGVAVLCEFDPSLPPVRGDERQLKQLFLNLVRNAIEAMEARGTLTLVTKMETDFHIVRPATGNSRFIRVEVRDTGPGIPTENLHRIFDPFFTTKPGGSGLGLAICEKIATAHGGGLSARNARNAGAVFVVNLPVARDVP
ncbi:MAG: PAS domain-containing sensor histidine kinase [Candidatus Binatia bacterium]|nr:MAG: PAS domain-containing sensor histidine kinase [Candidatus Binatia bacterium]